MDVAIRHRLITGTWETLLNPRAYKLWRAWPASVILEKFGHHRQIWRTLQMRGGQKQIKLAGCSVKQPKVSDDFHFRSKRERKKKVPIILFSSCSCLVCLELLFTHLRICTQADE